MSKLFKLLKETDRYLVSALTIVLILGLAGIAKEFFFMETKSLPDYGGTYSEAMLGRISSLNPLFSQGNSVDHDISSLIFSGLTKYDPETKEVTGDLAYKWELGEDYKTYTFHLRDNLYWQDGEILDSDDVVFTYNLIQDPLFEGRIKASFSDLTTEKIDSKTIKFSLSKENSFFPGSLHIGILPEHLLSNVPASQIYTAGFNLHPIGSGPFSFVSLSSNSKFDRVELRASENYYRERPFISNMVIFSYEDYQDLLRDASSFDGICDLDDKDSAKLADDFNIRALKLPRYEAAILNLDSPVLANQDIREALSLSLNKEEILKQMGSGELVNSALTIFEDYDYGYDLEKADELLTEAGFTAKEGQVYRSDEEKLLEIKLVTLDNKEKEKLAALLQAEWEKIGVKINVIAVEAGILNLEYIANRNYDILLIGQNLGSDMDLYSFWHSSQAKNGQNLSQLKSIDADILMEKIRSTHNFDKQLELTRKLADEINSEHAAIFLYTPYYNYAISKDVKRPLIPENISAPSDRYALINEWYVKEKRIWE